MPDNTSDDTFEAGESLASTTSNESLSQPADDLGAAPTIRRRKSHPLCIEFEAVPQIVRYEEFFGNDHPVELEVGCGKGLYLRNAAKVNPGHNFLGIEIARKYAFYGAERISKLGLTNVRIIPGDALLLLKRVPDASTNTVHLYFPDPWWKKRHHKRRVFTADFVKDVARILMVNGRFLIVTDVADYFAMVQEVMREFVTFEIDRPPETHEPQHDMDYLTNFERKFRREGRPIFRIGYKRVCRPN